jgi:hypothetical protein
MQLSKLVGAVKKVLANPAVILAVVTFFVFFTTLVVRIRTFYVFPDNIDQFFAWYQKLAQAVHHGMLPIWDANVSAGHSFVGELQQGVFYPVNLLWVGLFGSAAGISIFWLELIVVFHFWLASVGMYLAARSVGLRKTAALITGMFFAFGGGVAVRSVSQTAIFFGLCYIPWAFYFFQKWLTSKNRLALVGLSVTLGFSILSGHVDPWYFACVLIALSIIFRPIQPSFEPWLRTLLSRFVAFGIAVAGSLIVALPQVVLSAQYLPQAVRFVGDTQPIGPNDKVSAHTFTVTYSYKPENVLSVVDPVKYSVVDGNEVYITLLGLVVVLAAFGLFKTQLRENIVYKRQKTFIFGASAVAGIVMFGYWTFLPAVLRYLPLFSQVRQLARYSVIVQFCLALLAGICVEVLVAGLNATTSPHKKRRLQILAFGSVGFMTLNTAYLYLASKQTGLIDKHFVYQNLVVLLAVGGCFIVKKRAQTVLLLATMLAVITQPVWFEPRINSTPATYAPNYYKRTTAITYLEQFYGHARVLVQNNALPINIGDVYKIQTVGGYGATLHQSFFSYLNEADPIGQAGQHMDLLNVRFIVDSGPQPGLKKVFTDNVRHISIYERPHYLPRAFFADQVGVCSEHGSGCTPASITSYSDNHITAHSTAAEAKTLVFSEVNYTGWNAYVDGHKAAITSYGLAKVKLFRAVAVPAGTHTVELRYKPLGL